MTKTFFSIAILISIICIVNAAKPAKKIILSKLFSNHAVLQRNKPIRIWGWSEPEAALTIKFAGQQATVKANKNGKWLAVFKALPAGGPYTLSVCGEQTITRNDILVGDVWLCGGQSNMEWKVVHSNNGKEALSTADKYNKIRLFDVTRKFKRTLKANSRISVGNWKVCSRRNLTHFSAVGFYFGRELYQELNVPIGLISCNWGASTAETWMSPEATATIDSLNERVKKGDKLLGVTPEQLQKQRVDFKASWKNLIKEFSKLDKAAEYSKLKRIVQFFVMLF